MDTTDTTVGDTIMKMLGALEEHGWIQGSRQNEQGQMCAIGALSYVYTANARNPVSVYYDVLDQLAAHTGNGEYFGMKTPVAYIIEHNDERGRTFDDIRDWLTKAALDAGISL